MRLTARLACVLSYSLAAGCSDAPGDADAAIDGAVLTDAGGDVDAGCTEDIDCTDTLFCNGVERCTPTGCAPPDDPTPCNEETQRCVEEDDRCASLSCDNPDMDADGVNSEDCAGLDCDDEDPARYPGNSEICDAFDRDEDCDPATFGFRDGDMDGEGDALCCNADPLGALTCGVDCNDNAPTVNTTAPDVCNGRDDDCNGIIDDGMTMQPCFTDVDRDGWAAAGAASMMECGGCPVGSTDRDPAVDGADCDDGNLVRYPGAPELCDAVDDDCDGDTTDVDMIPCWADMDGDTWARTGAAMTMPCPDPTRMAAFYCPAGTTGRNPSSAPGADCNDANNAIYPTAPELCSIPAADNDCDGSGSDEPSCYVDGDGDGYGSSTRTCPGVGGACAAGDVANNTDCDDSESTVHPGGTELAGTCNGLDEDCDGTDDDGVMRTRTVYADTDDDGYGAGAGVTMTYPCPGPPAGYETTNTDCCDTDDRAHPGTAITAQSTPRVGCGGYDFNCDGAVTLQNPFIITGCTPTCLTSALCTPLNYTGIGTGWCDATDTSHCGMTRARCNCGPCGTCTEQSQGTQAVACR